MSLSQPASQADPNQSYYGLVTLSPSTVTTGTLGAPKIAGTYQSPSSPYYPAWPNAGEAAVAAAATPGYAPVGPGWFNAQRR